MNNYNFITLIYGCVKKNLHDYNYYSRNEGEKDLRLGVFFLFFFFLRLLLSAIEWNSVESTDEFSECSRVLRASSVRVSPPVKLLALFHRYIP